MKEVKIWAFEHDIFAKKTNDGFNKNGQPTFSNYR